MNTKISVIDAQKILDSLVHKDIFLSCGYGGVMFLEIGSITDHHFEHEEGQYITRKYGDHRLFCDENWSFSDGKNTRIDRWTSSSQEIDNLFESIGVQKLTKVEIINNFEKTIFYISGGYTFTIIRDDAVETFSIILIPENKRLTVLGNGDIDFHDYEEDMSHLKKGKPRPKRTESISIDRNFLRNQIPDLLPISFIKARELIQPALNQQIRAIEINSGTRFTLCFGSDYTTVPSTYRWSLIIDEEWVLKKGKEIVLDVCNERFHFEEKLASFLKNKQIIEMNFDKKGATTHIIFNDEYTLTVLEKNRYSRWSIYDRATGLSIGSYRDQGLAYRISSPIHLFDTYQTGDVNLDATLYELKFYRDHFAGNN